MVEVANGAISTAKDKQSVRIFHITENHSPGHPGVTAVITQLTRYLAGRNWRATVLTAGKALTPVPAGVDLVEFPLFAGGRFWRYPRNFVAYLEKLASQPGSILHLHGVWGAPQWLAARTAKKHKIPALLTAHDMLSPWHWQYKSLKYLKKIVYWRLLAQRSFSQLDVIHAITPKERDILGKLFPHQPLIVIPNAIDLQEADAMLREANGELSKKVNAPYVLFLGRLHPQKGVDILINAYAGSSAKNIFQLIIVGPESTPEYTSKLKALVQHLGIEQQVIFTGPVFGSPKWRLYRDAWAFFAPSRTEVIGLVNLEAAASRTPVITTHETGLTDWEEGGGILVNPNIAEVTQALDLVASWNEADRNSRGQTLRQLVERRYSWEPVGQQWLNLYSSLLARYG
jgi:glycosyltransferase involved in cell wall biosynthesis